MGNSPPPALDRKRFSRIAHGELAVWNPVPAPRVSGLLAAAGFPQGIRILDVGCGRGALLLNAVKAFAGTGVGVDIMAEAVAQARAAAKRRGLAERTVFRAEPFTDGAFSREAFDLILCVGSSHAAGGFPGVLLSLRPLLDPRGSLLLGEGYWRQPPAPEYLEFLGAREDDLPFAGEMSRVAAEHGFALGETYEVTPAEWDAYENTYAANVEAHVLRHPDDPQAEAMLQRIRPWQQAYRTWGRDTLGFAVQLLKRGDAATT